MVDGAYIKEMIRMEFEKIINMALGVIVTLFIVGFVTLIMVLHGMQ